MSTFLERRSEHGSSQALHFIGLDGKPTRISDRNMATATSPAARLFAQLAPFNRDASLFPLPPPSGCFAPPHDYPVWTKSTLLRLTNRTAIRVPGRPALNLLRLHGLLRSYRRIALTTAGSPGYAGIQNGGSRSGDSAAKASSSVPGALDIQGKEARS